MNKEISNKLKELLNNKYQNLNINDMFKNNPNRFTEYHLKVGNLLLDYSKNKINNEILHYLFSLAKYSNIQEKRDNMFSGKVINYSENRSVLHTALRDDYNNSILKNTNITNEIIKEKNKIKQIVNNVYNGYGFSGKKITDIINIGIGGSDLGPKMIVHALKEYRNNDFNLHFVSNIDGNSILDVLKKINPETALFIISSKSFNTEETLTNAKTARKWLINYHNSSKAISKHFIAISNNIKKVKDFGISLDNCLHVWDWVGGRYSIWSAIGISIVFAIGWENFEEMLKGALIIDKHFKTAPIENNMPVILAIISILYSNFYNTSSHAILAYDNRLSYLVNYLQQLDMESNGKSYNNHGELNLSKTGVVLWGGIGTNGQHAFHQLLHQGNILVPVDFIIIKQNNHTLHHHHNILLANALAQSKALMEGKNIKEIQKEHHNKNVPLKILNQKIVIGNKPSNTILIDKLNPNSLGQLIALYEHKIFVQGIIWDINSFDQWGVELGKELSTSILQSLENNKKNDTLDNSTQGLLNIIKKNNNVQ